MSQSPALFVLQHKESSSWVAEGAGTWGRITKNPGEAMQQTRDWWYEKLTKKALDHFELVPATHFGLVQA